MNWGKLIATVVLTVAPDILKGIADKRAAKRERKRRAESPPPT